MIALAFLLGAVLGGFVATVVVCACVYGQRREAQA